MKTKKKRVKVHKKHKPSKMVALHTIRKSIVDFPKRVRKIVQPEVVINNQKVQIWMIGHASILINLYGTTIVTDPMFTRGLPYPLRLVEPGLHSSDIPPIDFLVISHAHMDHLNIPSLKKLAGKTKTLIIPRNCQDLVRSLPFIKTVEMDVGEARVEENVLISTYKPQHWGRRLPWERIDRGYNSYLFEKNGVGIFFCGDSAYCEIFKEIGEEKKVDIALLPIGAYRPGALHSVHMNPEEALTAMIDLRATHMIPYHFGNFRISLEPLHEPEERLKKEAARIGYEKRIFILDNGGLFEL